MQGDNAMRDFSLIKPVAYASSCWIFAKLHLINVKWTSGQESS